MSAGVSYLDRLYRTSGAELVDELNAGLPAKVFDALATLLDVPRERLASFLGLSARTLRKRQAKLTADEAERTFRAFRVFRRAVEVLGDDRHAREWLQSPQRALGERAPITLLVRDVGAEHVHNVLNAIEQGAYL